VEYRKNYSSIEKWPKIEKLGKKFQNQLKVEINRSKSYRNKQKYSQENGEILDLKN